MQVLKEVVLLYDLWVKATKCTLCILQALHSPSGYSHIVIIILQDIGAKLTNQPEIVEFPFVRRESLAQKLLEVNISAQLPVPSLTAPVHNKVRTYV